MVLWRSIWLALWRSIWFRYAAYGVARTVGEARRWLVSGWLPHAIRLAAVGGAGMCHGYMQQTGTFCPWTFVTWEFVAKVAVVYGLLWLIVHAYRSRGRVVVLTTVNHAGQDFDGFTAGLAAHVANDLGLLSELHKTIDEANPPPQSGERFPALKVGVDNPADALASVVGEKSDVTLGLVSVSLRPLIGIRTFDSQTTPVEQPAQDRQSPDPARRHCGRRSELARRARSARSCLCGNYGKRTA